MKGASENSVFTLEIKDPENHFAFVFGFGILENDEVTTEKSVMIFAEHAHEFLSNFFVVKKRQNLLWIIANLRLLFSVFKNVETT